MGGLKHKRMKLNNISKYLTIWVLLIIGLIIPMQSYSCSTPVFRYALEMWPAFNFRVEVVHSGNLSDEQIAALNELKNASGKKVTSNIQVSESADFSKFKETDNGKPIIFLLPPAEQGVHEVIWKGELNSENVKRIIDSPARQKIVQNIQKGDAVTWVLVEGNDKIKNDKAKNTLQEELVVLSQKLKLASDATDVEGNLLDIDIIQKGVSFSMLSISRDNAAEEVFIQMLLHTEADLPFVKSPMAFPVFGRGRVLYALVGNGIKSKLIEATCNSVIGWCSCTIKEDNPGADLLFTADWEAVAGDSTWIKEVDLPEITGMSGFLEEEKKEKEANTEAKTNSIQEESVKEEPAVKLEKDVTPSVNQPIEKVSIEEKQKVQVEVISPESVDESKKETNPLTRNILIVVVSLLIVLPSISLYLRKKRS